MIANAIFAFTASVIVVGACLDRTVRARDVAPAAPDRAAVATSVEGDMRAAQHHRR